MALCVDHLEWDGRGTRVWRNVFLEDGLSRRNLSVCEESNGGVFVAEVFQRR